MEDKKKNYPSKITLILRIVISAYLLYLTWGLREAPSVHEGMQRIFFIAAMIVFAVVAIVLGGFSLKALLNGEYDNPAGQEDSENNDEGGNRK